MDIAGQSHVPGGVQFQKEELGQDFAGLFRIYKM
jgi:hypothetical protein